MKKFIFAILFLAAPALAAAPTDWKTTQDVRVAVPGLTRIRLPFETLGAAQSTLSDLLLLNADGREIPFSIDQPTPEPARDLPLERMTATMEKKKTVITGAVPAAMHASGFESITLLTPTDDFLKPVSLEGSTDGAHWKMLIHQGPIFKQTGDPMSSTLHFPKGGWAFLRITLDDSDTPPLRVSQVRLWAPGKPVQDLQEFEPKILEIGSDAHHTEIRLQLPAEGLPIDAMRFDVSDSTFRRQVKLSGREFSAGEFHENAISQGSLYRITLGGQKTEELSVPVGSRAAGTQVTLILENGDSPPLTVRHVWFKVIPRDLVFDAPAAGVYQLCSGNPKATLRVYDVATLRGSFSRAVLPSANIGPVIPNPAYQPPQPVIAGEEEGSDIDTDHWHFRKKVILHPLPNVGEGGRSGDLGEGASLWRIELDPEAVAHNGGRIEALRLVRNDKQLPYVMDYAGVERSLAPTLEPQPAAAKNVSRWLITLPYAGMPISRLHFTVPDALFQRTLTLYEVAEELPEQERNVQNPINVPEGIFEAAGSILGVGGRSQVIDRTVATTASAGGEETAQGKPLRILASATWTRVRPDSPTSYELVLAQAPQTSRLILETDNGDNAPIHPGAVQAYYRAPRLLFQSKPNKASTYLYYGQPEIAAPQYDLNLIAADLLSTPPQEASLGAEEPLKSTPWWEPPVPTGGGKTLFWGIMILVVLGLLVVIAKLLPEETKNA